MGVSPFNRARSINLMHGKSTGATVPVAPSLLSVTPGVNENDLSWTDNSDDETDFAIFRGTDGVLFAEIDTVTAGVTTYNDPGLTNGQIYYYYIKARNAVGDSDASNIETGTPFSSLMTDLSSFWKMSDTSDSAGTRTLTNVGTTTFTAGKVDNASTFAIASGQYLKRTAEVQNFTSEFSISLWAKQTTATNDRTFLQLGNSGGTPTNFIKIESQYVHMGGSTATTTTTFTNMAPTTAWVHIVVVINGLNCRIYRNNVDSGNIVLNQAFADSSRLLLFGAYNNGAGDIANFDGQLDAVGLWNRALTADEVEELYNVGDGLEHSFLPTTPSYDSVIRALSPAGWWDFNGQTGADGSNITVATDISGNNRDVTNAATAPLVKENGIGSRKVANFSTFVDRRLQTASWPTTGNGAFTVFMVARLTGSNTGSHAQLQLGSSGTGGQCLQTGLRDFGGINMVMTDRSSNLYTASTPDMAINTNYIQCIRRTNNTTNIYRANGEFKAPNFSWTANIVGNRLCIGGSSLEAAYFLGYIGEVVIFHSALSDADVTLVEEALNSKWGVY